MVTVAVVIPFYQREPGILKRALSSVFSQNLPENANLKIFVVDDASPFSLSTELASVDVPTSVELVTLARENGGPGAARNTALAWLNANDTNFVAFLDSDDEWKPSHIADALSALGEDGDFFFCDHDRWYEAESWFDASKVFQGWLASPVPPFEPYRAAENDVMQFKDGAAFQCFVEDYLAQTSTVVYRFSRLAGLKFDIKLRHAGEDNMFWLDLASNARVVRFSRQKKVVCGRGVNIYLSSLSWDHEDALRRISDQLLFCVSVMNRFKPSGQIKVVLQRQIWMLQKTIIRIAAKQLRLKRRVDLHPLLAPLKLRPSLLVSLPAAACAAFGSNQWISNA